MTVPTVVIEGEDGNAVALRVMAQRSKNPTRGPAEW